MKNALGKSKNYVIISNLPIGFIEFIEIQKMKRITDNFSIFGKYKQYYQSFFLSNNDLFMAGVMTYNILISL